MTGFWKLKKEWVLERGLTAAEALLYADILSWNKHCTLEQRAKRVGMSIEGVRKALIKIEEKGVEFQHSGNENSTKLKNNFNKVEKSVNKVEKIKKEKKENSPTPPIIKKIKNEEEHIEEHILPSASDGVKKKKKKYTPEEQKYHGELRDIFLSEWKQINGDDYEMSAADMVAIIKIKNSLKFKLKADGYRADDLDYLKDCFHVFIKKTLTGAAGDWLINQDPKVIASKFNTIYTTLRNGKPSTNRQQGVTDEYIRGIAERLAETGGLAF